MADWCIPNNRINTIYFYLSFTLLFYFSFFSSIRSSICHFNPLVCRGSCLSFVQTSFGRRRSSLVECRQRPWLPSESIKPEYLVCQTGQSGFCSFGQELPVLSDSCGNTFWRLRWGIDYLKHVKPEGWKLRQQRIRPRQGQHPQAHLRHLNGRGSQGVRSLPRRSQRALPLVLWSDAAGDCSSGYYTDHL
jgi:hypothetical protein